MLGANDQTHASLSERELHRGIHRGHARGRPGGTCGFPETMMSEPNQGGEENAPDRGDSEDDGTTPPKNRWWKALLLAFCCWHAVYLIISIAPAAPSRGDRGNPVLDLYRLMFGGVQQWNMFDTIPVLHSLDVRFESKDATGAKITRGCVLPGFKPYPKPESARYYVLLGRLATFSNDTPYRDVSMRKAAGLLPPPGAGESWSFVVDEGYTRNLFHIRRDGHISMPVTKTLDVNNPGASPPP